jgi:isopentenyldiphosphate isomerase
MERPDLGFPPAFPGFWDITIAGHPRWGQRDYVTQISIEVKEELRIEHNAEDISYVGKFQYHAPDPTYPNPRTAPTFRLSEREICGVGVLYTNERPIINKAEVQASVWAEKDGLKDQMRSLKVAPWALMMLDKYPNILAG